MRIIDKVLQSPSLETFIDARGKHHRLAGPAARANDVQECQLRFVLDRAASRQCVEMLFEADVLPALDEPLLRLPAERFWLEIYTSLPDDPEPAVTGSRIGLLIETDFLGRKGNITCFPEQLDGSVRLCPGRVMFDLDNQLGALANGRDRFRLRHRDLDDMSSVLNHVVMCLDPSWRAFAKSAPGRTHAEFLGSQAEHLWFALPMLLTFCALLNTGSILDQKPTELARLNKARIKRGRRPLLDHIEVSLRLGWQREVRLQTTYGSSPRSHPRLHYVRGHPVNRDGKTFWRTAHLRGDPSGPPLTRTVSVTAGRRKLGNG